ncbi:MAG TPA: hypothetical protein VF163_15575 [Micromonosporaceae bacterium]
MIVRMWEVRAQQRNFTELLAWVCDVAIPAIEYHPLHISSEVFSSPDFRLVVISKWRSSPEAFQEPPAHLVTRPPHTWDFSPVDR